MPPTVWAHKGEAVEEWSDLRFFRPLGLKVAEWLRPTPVTADQVTVAAMVIGVFGAHLFYYPSASLNWLGLALLVFSDILDSTDGQLARMRGTSTRWGRMLDGISDNVRFVALYLHLMIRMLVLGGTPGMVIPLVLAAGISHSVQSSIADFLRHVFLWLVGSKSELDLPEDIDSLSATGLNWIRLSSYRGYVRRQALLCADSAVVVRQRRRSGLSPEFASKWWQAQRPWIGRLAWIGTNIRFPLLAIAILAGHPSWFLWSTIIGLNAALAWIVVGHERNARALAGAGVPVTQGA